MTALMNILIDEHAKGRKTVLIIRGGTKSQCRCVGAGAVTDQPVDESTQTAPDHHAGTAGTQEQLSRPELRQLAQRIAARYHIGPLSKEEVAAYVNTVLLWPGHTVNCPLIRLSANCFA